MITSFVAGRSITFPLWVFGVSRLGVPPEVNVLGTLIFVVALVFVLINYLLTLLAAWLSRFLSFRTAGRTKPAEGPMAAEETTV